MLNGWDFGIIVCYVLMIITVGCGASYLQKRKNAKEGKGDGSYFLASNTLKWPIIGLSLFSTNISTVHIVALAEEGYKNGLAYGNFELASAFTLIILAVFFVPFYLRSQVTTLPDFLEKRYNRSCRDFLAFVSIISAIFIHIGASLYAGGIVINKMLGFSIEWSSLLPTIILIAVATGIYTVVGGLLAVALTDTIQTLTLLVGSSIVTYIAYNQLGGWAVLEETTGPVMTSVMRSGDDPSGLSWYSILLGYPVIGIWYWCTDQTIVQRVLGAKNEAHGKAGALFAGFIKMLPMFIFILPGLLCFALVDKGMLPALADSKNAFAHLVMNILPTGMRGLIAAALLAALMGTIAGALNSVATLFSFDLYKRFKPDTSDKQLVRVGRIATVVGIVIAIVWSPVLGMFGSLYAAFASMISYLAPPITAVFMVGIFWKGATPKGAITTLWSGFGLGGIVFVLDIFKEHTGWSVPFLLSAAILCAISCVILVIVSLITDQQHTEESEKLVWESPLAPLRIPGAAGVLNYKFLTVVLFVVTCAVFYAFRMPTDKEQDAWERAHPVTAAKIRKHRGIAQKKELPVKREIAQVITNKIEEN